MNKTYYWLYSHRRIRMLWFRLKNALHWKLNDREDIQFRIDKGEKFIQLEPRRYIIDTPLILSSSTYIRGEKPKE